MWSWRCPNPPRSRCWRSAGSWQCAAGEESCRPMTPHGMSSPGPNATGRHNGFFAKSSKPLRRTLFQPQQGRRPCPTEWASSYLQQPGTLTVLPQGESRCGIPPCCKRRRRTAPRRSRCCGNCCPSRTRTRCDYSTRGVAEQRGFQRTQRATFRHMPRSRSCVSLNSSFAQRLRCQTHRDISCG
jgi:hypothetical protein